MGDKGQGSKGLVSDPLLADTAFPATVCVWGGGEGVLNSNLSWIWV